jgi:hypothetical protein
LFDILAEQFMDTLRLVQVDDELVVLNGGDIGMAEEVTKAA